MTAKTYTEMTKADLDRVSGQMAGAMAQMQEQMKNMPPEARKRMEATMQGRGMPGGAGVAARTEYKKVGTDKVGKWTCDKYEGTRDGEKVAELCTVAPATLGFTPADFEVTRQMADFFSKLVPQGADQMFRIGSTDGQRIRRAARPHRDVPQRRAEYGVGNHRRQPPGFSGYPVRGTRRLREARPARRPRPRSPVTRSF